MSSEREWLEGLDERTEAERQSEFMNPHPFDVVETITPDENDPEPPKGNQAYYDWLETTITAATRKPVPWIAVELAIALDRAIREHEAEMAGGPKCAECVARDKATS